MLRNGFEESATDHVKYCLLGDIHGGLDIDFHAQAHRQQLGCFLIDLGVDVLDPVQPGAMEIEQVAKQFGGRIAFAGGINPLAASLP